MRVLLELLCLCPRIEAMDSVYFKIAKSFVDDI